LDIAGYYSKLKKGFDELGAKCDLYTIGSHPFNYELSEQNWTAKAFSSMTGALRKISISNPWFLKKISRYCENIIKLFLLVFSLFKYDVFIFGFKKCFFKRYRFADLPILKLFKKKIIFVFHGSDARPPYICGNFLSKDNNDLPAVAKKSKKILNDIKKIEKYADFVVNHPPTSHFHQKATLSFLQIGIPTETRVNQLIREPDEANAVRIVHSPSKPKIKGTDEIRKVISTLKSKGYHIEFIEISNQPNSVVLEALAGCDFIVDQLYSTTPMPGFVAEAASFGKPAVICGYFHDQIHKISPPGKIPPSYFCHPAEIEDAIKKLVTDREFRLELGKKAHEFVLEHWNVKKVAERYLKVINGYIPEDWFFDPRENSYVQGACMPEYRAQKAVKSLIATYGKEALLLDDKPELEKKFIEFANS